MVVRAVYVLEPFEGNGKGVLHGSAHDADLEERHG